MKKEIGFVAVGQAGGNIGSVLEEKGFNVLYLNTSAEDLSTLENAKYKYHIEGGEGCHKDRDKAKTLFARDFDKILEEIKTKVPEKIVFVIFSTGGGTGSGIGPVMVDILSDELEKSAGAVAVLPGKNETVKAFMNSYECMKELADVENTAACFFTVLLSIAAQTPNATILLEYTENPMPVTFSLATRSALSIADSKPCALAISISNRLICA